MISMAVAVIALVLATAALAISVRRYHGLTGRWLPFGPPKDPK